MKRHLKSVLFLFTKKRNLKASSYILHKPVNQLVLFVEWHCKDILFHCSQLLGFAIFLFIFIQYKFGKAHISTSVIIYKLIYTCVAFVHICWLFCLYLLIPVCIDQVAVIPGDASCRGIWYWDVMPPCIKEAHPGILYCSYIEECDDESCEEYFKFKNGFCWRLSREDMGPRYRCVASNNNITKPMEAW